MLAGGVIDRGLRWVLKWFLSYALGPVGLGLYELAWTVAATITSFSPLGLDTGIVYFAARQKRGGERDALKGTLLAGGAISVVLGLISAVLLAVLAPRYTDDPVAIMAYRWMAPVVALWTPLLFAVGALRAVKDMRRSVRAFLVVLPLVLLAGAGVAVGLLGLGVEGVVGALVLASLVGLVLAARWSWRHYRDVLSDPALKARFAVWDLLRFSIPQSLAAAAFRLNMRADVLMLGALTTTEDVGIYAVAASLASFGSIPTNAVTSIFNPFIAELVFAGETERLDALLKTVTRWLVIVSAPVFLGLVLLADLVVAVYPGAFAAAALPLVVLSVGQAVNTACAPTMRLIPMSGHAMLNLVNGVVALVLNLVLNWLWIPEHGALGAAAATGATLAAWSLWRVVEVWFMLRCFPFDLRTTLLMAVAGGGGAALFLADLAPAPRVGGTVVLLLVFGALALTVGRTPEDRALLARATARVRKRLGR